MRDREWSGAKFKIHSMKFDPAGKLKKLVMTWLAHQRGGFSVDPGICPGYIAYEAP